MKDLSVARAIADTVDVCPDLPLLEVGPGMSVPTQYLLTKGRSLKVAELDFESVEYLRRNFPQLEEHIIEDDFFENVPRKRIRRPFVSSFLSLSFLLP